MDYEKLGAFYLGKEYDLHAGQRRDRLVMYDARDLTTHAVCLGMTGSGKTGLCIGLLEEAAIDDIPAILIDPKGDITNLLLTFPELRPEDFQPWINPDDARRKGRTVEEHAGKVAQQWKDGLAEWDQDGERIRRMRERAEFRVYTPGSDAGLKVSVLASLRCPGLDWDEHAEDLREQVRGTVSAILGLLGIDADPLRSREHILLSNIFEHYWRNGEDLDLSMLILAVQQPPMQKLGVFDVETFFPEKDRFGLAMQMNNIMAAPSFASWIEGDPLDVAQLLHSPSGKPRHSIFYIAHLSDDERMFFVTLLLEQVLTWMRKQSGTTSLRALLYMDEIFGFFPPVQNPPSKRPLMTLLKQARAFGVGCVLATQNPVDLDYKGLSNTGTWFLGKLQTERDKARVLEGLETATQEAGGSLDRGTLDRLLSSLGSRVFLMHNVHADRPVLFETRWVMSYLRGPLTRRQIKKLMKDVKQLPEETPEPRKVVSREVPAAPAGPPDAGAGGAATAVEKAEEPAASRPPVSDAVPQVWMRIERPRQRALEHLEQDQGRSLDGARFRVVYEPSLLALGQVHFVDTRRGVNESRVVGRLFAGHDVPRIVRWDELEAVELDANDLGERAEDDAATYDRVSEDLASTRVWKTWRKEFTDHLYRSSVLEIFHHPVFKMYGESGESERDFKARVKQAARERRDEEVDKLRRKMESKLRRLEQKLEKEREDLEEDEEKHEARRREEMLSAGESVLGFLGLFGRKSRTGASKAATKRRLTATAKRKVEETRADIERLESDIAQMQEDIQEDIQEITEKWEELEEGFGTHAVKPRRADVKVDVCALAWMPAWEIEVGADGRGGARHRVPAWREVDRTRR